MKAACAARPDTSLSRIGRESTFPGRFVAKKSGDAVREALAWTADARDISDGPTEALVTKSRSALVGTLNRRLKTRCGSAGFPHSRDSDGCTDPVITEQPGGPRCVAEVAARIAGPGG